MTVLQFFKALFAAPEPPEPPDAWATIDAEIARIYREGLIPLTARITTGLGHGKTMILPISSSSTREQAYAAIEAAAKADYGPHVTITVTHLCSAPDDDELGTVRHSAAVEARCEHGLTQRICTVNVVTNRGEQ